LKKDIYSAGTLSSLNMSSIVELSLMKWTEDEAGDARKGVADASGCVCAG
jgi:hypothetical protein